MAKLRSYLAILVILLCFTTSLQFKDDDDDGDDDDDDFDFLCDDFTCEDLECPDTSDCQYGLVPDVCQCCFLCAKGPGEQCGGMFDLAGTCADGYNCKPHPKYSQLPGVCLKK